MIKSEIHHFFHRAVVVVASVDPPCASGGQGDHQSILWPRSAGLFQDPDTQKGKVAAQFELCNRRQVRHYSDL